MQIPTIHHGFIQRIDVNSAQTVVSWRHWEATLKDDTYLLPRVIEVKKALGPTFNRANVVDFYKSAKVPAETQFIAAMIWGHESDAVENRDGRGPWKLSQTFADSKSVQAAIRACSVSNDSQTLASYAMLRKSLKRCGPNFFTKHFYFLGKASGRKDFPLIFDNRVAQGLARISSKDKELFNMISVAPIARPESYMAYLLFSHAQAVRIGCAPDQVELFLFNLKE